MKTPTFAEKLGTTPHLSPLLREAKRSGLRSPGLWESLAVAERCVAQVRYIADAALLFERRNPFWRRLLDHLPAAPPVKEGVMAHPTRFVSMTGMTRSGTRRVTVWNRPRADLMRTRG